MVSFSHSLRPAPLEPHVGKGYPGPSRRPPGGPGRPHALALGRGRSVGPEGQVEMEVGKGCFFGGQDFGTDDDLQLILAENYSLTTNDLTTEITERTEDAQSVLKGIPGSLQHRYLCGPWASLARLSFVAAARGPGLGCAARQGGLACLAGTGGQEARRAKTTGSREGAKPRSSDKG